MSERSEQRSGVEDWRDAAEAEKKAKPRGRFPWLLALIVVVAVVGFVVWRVAG